MALAFVRYDDEGNLMVEEEEEDPLFTDFFAEMEEEDEETEEEQEEGFNEIPGTAAFDTLISVDVDDAMEERIIDEVVRLTQQYPILSTRLRYVTTNYTFGDEYTAHLERLKKRVDTLSTFINVSMAFAGFCETEPNPITGTVDWFDILINKEEYADIDLVFQDEIISRKMEVYDHFHSHPTGCHTIESVITHEFGHGMYYWIRALISTEQKNQMDAQLKRLRRRSILTNLIDMILHRNSIGWYAVTDNTEAFAVGFEAMQYGDLRAQNHPITRYVRSVVEEYNTIKILGA